MKFVTYKLTTGEITGVGNCPDATVDNQVKPGEGIIKDATADDAVKYVDVATEDFIDKPVMPCSINKTNVLADGSDSIIISGLPNPSHILIKGEDSWTTTDGIFEITFDTVGTYEVIILSSLYLEEEYIINAS